MKYKTKCQMCRATKGFTKKPSIRAKKEMAKQSIKQEQKRAKELENTDLSCMEKYKFGIFNKKGYVAISVWETREQAERELAKYKVRSPLYEIREIISW